MLIGSIGLRARTSSSPRTSYFLMLLVCGVNIPVDELPGWLQAIAEVVPLTHGIEAAREAAAGAGLGDVAGLVGTGFSRSASVYTAAAFALFRWFEIEVAERGARDHLAQPRVGVARGHDAARDRPEQADGRLADPHVRTQPSLGATDSRDMRAHRDS